MQESGKIRVLRQTEVEGCWSTRSFDLNGVIGQPRVVKWSLGFAASNCFLRRPSSRNPESECSHDSYILLYVFWMIEQFTRQWEVLFEISDEIRFPPRKMMIVRFVSGLWFTHKLRDVRIQCQGTQEPWTHLLKAIYIGPMIPWLHVKWDGYNRNRGIHIQ